MQIRKGDIIFEIQDGGYNFTQYIVYKIEINLKWQFNFQKYSWNSLNIPFYSIRCMCVYAVFFPIRIPSGIISNNAQLYFLWIGTRNFSNTIPKICIYIRTFGNDTIKCQYFESATLDFDDNILN